MLIYDQMGINKQFRVAGFELRSWVAGRRSQVAGRRSQVAGRRSQVDNMLRVVWSVFLTPSPSQGEGRGEGE